MCRHPSFWVLILVVGLGPSPCVSAEKPLLELVSKETFIPSATPGVRVGGFAFYTHPEGVEMMCRFSEQTQSDKADISYRMFSEDNGKTWSKPEPFYTFRKVEGGTLRRGFHPGFADTGRDVLLTFQNRGVFPNDDPLEGMWRWTLWYSLSSDGGKTDRFTGPVIQRGEEFDEQHPLEGVWVGKNSAMLGDTTCRPIRIRTGEILQPVQITPIGPDGKYFNPGGGYTYHDSAVLIGTWNDSGTLDWELSQRVKADPMKSTRGMLEPTVAEFPDGRILMVMRGSNHSKPDLPSYRWYSISEDHGRTWSKPRPWTTTDGETFFSPSSCSQLLRHSSGRYFWIGNICPDNADGNLPRYPLLIGEVDPKSLSLKRETLCTIDTRRSGDWDRVMFSNFYAHEDRETGEIVVYLSPTFRQPPPQPNRSLDWSADLCRYRIRVNTDHEGNWPLEDTSYLNRFKQPEPILRPTGKPGDFDSKETDCPCVVWDGEGERWIMAYAGWDGEKNRIGLAESKDLVRWRRLGEILGTATAGTPDRGSVSAPFLIRHDGYWYLFYCGFPETGYEAGPGTTNIARSRDLKSFDLWASEVLRPGPESSWDGGGIYKLSVYRIDGRFYAFYNAKDVHGMEQTGLAVSEDLRTWKKDPSNPILRTDPGRWDSRFASDPCLLKIQGFWHLFYYGYDGKTAQEGVAVSPDGDLRHWIKFPGNPILGVGPKGSYDWKYAHKPCVIEHQGIYYHFYCGVGHERAICLATSKPLPARDLQRGKKTND